MHVLRPEPRILLAAAISVAILAFFTLTFPAQLSGLDLNLGSRSDASSSPQAPAAAMRATSDGPRSGADSLFADPVAPPLETLERPVPVRRVR